MLVVNHENSYCSEPYRSDWGHGGCFGGGLGGNSGDGFGGNLGGGLGGNLEGNLRGNTGGGYPGNAFDSEQRRRQWRNDANIGNNGTGDHNVCNNNKSNGNGNNDNNNIRNNSNDYISNDNNDDNDTNNDHTEDCRVELWAMAILARTYDKIEGLPLVRRTYEYIIEELEGGNMKRGEF